MTRIRIPQGAMVTLYTGPATAEAATTERHTQPQDLSIEAELLADGRYHYRWEGQQWSVWAPAVEAQR